MHPDYIKGFEQGKKAGKREILEALHKLLELDEFVADKIDSHESFFHKD